ncbi:pannexin-1-like [Rhinatrema bivittatum]|uniref:pannexin-1-like n=1 Tax=Rhinatrema bivittatum TaxID=194408 RepID=UPI0011288912|nr:pannexin-1-like [Rhinatrema bivittatum]XP_029458204.1 pannexin-1-like [Rhinatrema bivittatum]
MAIAHLATEYVFSDFLLKEPSEAKYKGLRLELAVDKLVTCIGVGLPLLLISLAFAQEITMGAQISCFAPTAFSWRQAAYVDSFCWAAVQQKHLSHSEAGNIPLWLHKFFPYILLLVAVLLYLPSLFWRFTAAPHLCSDLKFILEELDKAYNIAIKAAKSYSSGDKKEATSSSPTVENLAQSVWEISENHFTYPLVEQYLKSKKRSKDLIIKYLICRILTLIIMLLACIYLGYYINLFSLTDEFTCNIRTGILKNDTALPALIQCKLIAVGVFRLLSYINLIVYALVMPFVVYTLIIPFRKRSDVLKVYEILPTFDVLQFHSEYYNDISLFLLFIEENISELKSYKCLKVLENIKSQTEHSDPMQLLLNLGTVKTDTVDGKRAIVQLDSKNETKNENNATELKDQSPNEDTKTSQGDKKVRQRLLDSSC